MTRPDNWLNKLSVKMIKAVGTPMSLVAHSFFFVGIFLLGIFGVSFQVILLILTTLVSLEAIYLAIFIQMTVNRSFKSISEVEEDIDKIQEEVKDLGVDVEEISEDVEEISEDIVILQATEQNDAVSEKDTKAQLEKIQGGLQKLMNEIENIRKSKFSNNEYHT